MSRTGQLDAGRLDAGGDARAGARLSAEDPFPARRPTLKSVAERAGVSVSTASLVFSGNGPVAEQTRAKVRAAADELGYAGPDPLAASLRRGRADVVGVVVEGSLRFALRDPFALSVVDGLASVLDELPTGMLLLSQDPADPEALLRRIRGTALDAVVFSGCGPEDNVLVPHLRGRGIPVVALGAPLGEGVVVIDIDNRTAMHQVVTHLLELGHDPARIAVLALPLTPDDERRGRAPAALGEVLGRDRYADVRHRLLGVRDLLGDQVRTSVATGTDIEAGSAAATALLEADEPPTAIVALSDLLAMGVVRAAADRGLSVPGDLSVTGFDGIETAWWAGELTTVVQPGTAKGVRAGRAVQRALADETDPGELVDVRLRVGTSTAPPRGR